MVRKILIAAVAHLPLWFQKEEVELLKIGRDMTELKRCNKSACMGPYKLTTNHEFNINVVPLKYRKTFAYSYWLTCESGKRLVVPMLMSEDSGKWEVVTYKIAYSETLGITGHTCNLTM